MCFIWFVILSLKYYCSIGLRRGINFKRVYGIVQLGFIENNLYFLLVKFNKGEKKILFKVIVQENLCIDRLKCCDDLVIVLVFKYLNDFD